MITDAAAKQSRRRSSDLLCGVVNLLDLVGSVSSRVLLYSGIGWIHVSFDHDIRNLDAELRLTSEARRGCRRLERMLAHHG